MPESNNLLLSRAASRHEIDHLWYGVRHIFRTNAAVDNFTYSLNQLGVARATLGGLAGILSLR